MEVSRCYRCGAFYTNEGYVCSTCMDKDNFEVTKFKTFVAENQDVNSIHQISYQTGISEKNLNHFLTYSDLKDYKKMFK